MGTIATLFMLRCMQTRLQLIQIPYVLGYVGESHLDLNDTLPGTILNQ